MYRPVVACLCAAALFGAGPASAECPPAPDHRAALDALFAEARAAPSEAAGRALMARMWRFWADAPDEVAQTLLDRGVQAREAYDLLAARDAFDRLVAYCPDYAEGYNQRAFVTFLQQDYAAVLPDLEAALARNPRHVPALAGKAVTLMALGRLDEAQASLRAALALNPWITERHLLVPPAGTDL
ncbi:tetratricopeptide repeat protein [Roseivivax sp. CAU 1761]